MKEQIKGILYILVISLFVVITFNYLDEKKLLKPNKSFLKHLNDGFDYVNISDKKNFTFDSLKEKIDLKDIINYEYKNLYFIPKKDVVASPVVKEEVLEKESEQKKDPIVYIYTTHQKEEYSYDKNAPYNITPTVMNTSYMLKENLSKHDIESIVEERSISNILKKNNWKYASSYRASRILLEDSKKNNPSLEFFIDVHRDSVKKGITTIEFENKKYARVLFILGLENKNYEKNSKMIEYINNEINKKYPKLSRGIYKKKGKGVNGIYNQDFSANCILIEFGGVENTIDEVYNTVLVVSEILSKYIGENYEYK